MLSHTKDDTHLRWEKQSAVHQEIWEYYDKVVAPEIIKSALGSSCHLSELYQVLSITRLRCECEKKTILKEKVSQETTVAIARKTSFGTFQHGNSVEERIGKNWGGMVNDLLQERMGGSLISRGLSSFCQERPPYSDTLTHLLHPEGAVLERLDPIFQELIITNNFFEFLQLSARMMFDLSNFPPTTRGSAAVNSWLIDVIAQVRFNTSASIRPLLYDWMAFFETPEQYIAFYVLSATTKYIQTIPVLYEAHQQFFDSIPDFLMRNPNISANQQERKKIWIAMQAYITSVLKSGQLAGMQKRNLSVIAQGTLKFRESSDEVKQLVNLYKEHNEQPLNKTNFAKMVTNSDYSMKKFFQLLRFHYNTAETYLNAYDEEALNADWADLEMLRGLPLYRFRQPINKTQEAPKKSESLCSISNFSRDPTKLSARELRTILKNKPALVQHHQEIYYIDNDYRPVQLSTKYPRVLQAILRKHQSLIEDEPQDLTFSQLYQFFLLFDYIPPRFNDEIVFFKEISFATSADMLNLSNDILILLTTPKSQDSTKLKNLKEHLQEAILSGGVKIQDLIDLNVEQIEKIASPQAIALYKENRFIRASDILSSFATEAKEKDSVRNPLLILKLLFWKEEKKGIMPVPSHALGMSRKNQ